MRQRKRLYLTIIFIIVGFALVSLWKYRSLSSVVHSSLSSKYQLKNNGTSTSTLPRTDVKQLDRSIHHDAIHTHPLDSILTTKEQDALSKGTEDINDENKERNSNDKKNHEKNKKHKNVEAATSSKTRTAHKWIFTQIDIDRICNETNDLIHLTHSRIMDKNFSVDTSVASNLSYSEAIRNVHAEEEKEKSYWPGTLKYPSFQFLTCDQLTRSLQFQFLRRESGVDKKITSTMNYTSSSMSSTSIMTHNQTGHILLHRTLALQRLAAKLQKLNNTNNVDHHEDLQQQQSILRILVIGGSMTTGFVDYGLSSRELAWPRKLEQLMHEKWNNDDTSVNPSTMAPSSSNPHRVEVINLSVNAANEETWLGRLDTVMEQAPFDVILVESAVNDQCGYDHQAEKSAIVNATSYDLLNLLSNFPGEPAVISVELFRTAFRNRRDAKNHCPQNMTEVFDPLDGQVCDFCPQWWMPQGWRTEARDRNSIARVSYRDAVWPIQDDPPLNLCKFWDGMSHPTMIVHTLVASTIMFQFLAMVNMQERDILVTEKDLDGILEEDEIIKVDAPIVNPPNVCVRTVSSYRAMNGNDTDPMTLSQSGDASCWKFMADVRKKYGWICELRTLPDLKNASGESGYDDIVGNNRMLNLTETHEKNKAEVKDEQLLLRKEITVGSDKRVIVSRLVSYDERMASAEVWFSSVTLNTMTTQVPSYDMENVFIGSPTWEITSQHKDQTSIPVPITIQLENLNFTNSSGMHWNNGKNGNPTTIIFNIRLLSGTSIASKKNGTGDIDKFKLIGVVTC